MPANQSRRCRFLDGILGLLAVVQDRIRNAAEVVESRSVDRFDLVLGCATSYSPYLLRT
jgi:hypothetical protein